MGIRITGSGAIEGNLRKAQESASNSLEKLSSGVRFTRQDPMPAERAVSDSMTSKLRELSSYKRNANDGLSVVQLADSALNEISNITLRMKELATQASSATLSDKERKFLFVEYQSLHEEIDRISKTTSFNGMDLLNGNTNGSGTDSLAFRVGPAGKGEDGADGNLVTLGGLEAIVADTANLGLKSVSNLLKGDGISLDDVEEIFESNIDTVSDSFGAAFDRLAQFRASFGAVGSRLSHVMDVLDVTHENIAAANSRLRDVDYASEIANLTKANILVQAGASLLTQGNVPAQVALQLIKAIDS